MRKNYLYQISDGTLLEETVKLVILSPLLELAGFDSTPYKFRAEVPVEIEVLGDDDEILRGRIDGLVLLEQLWVVVIESKKTTFDLEIALPQALAYVAASPRRDLPLYGMAVAIYLLRLWVIPRRRGFANATGFLTCLGLGYNLATTCMRF